jgi:hypothetical protein
VFFIAQTNVLALVCALPDNQVRNNASCASAIELNQIPAIKSVLWSANQTLANMEVLASSAAIVLWSVELLDKTRLIYQKMTQIIILQSIWHFIMAYLMIKYVTVNKNKDQNKQHQP